MAYTRNKRKTFWHVNRQFFSGSICFNHLVISFFFFHACVFFHSFINFVIIHVFTFMHCCVCCWSISIRVYFMFAVCFVIQMFLWYQPIAVYFCATFQLFFQCLVCSFFLLFTLGFWSEQTNAIFGRMDFFRFSAWPFRWSPVNHLKMQTLADSPWGFREISSLAYT